MIAVLIGEGSTDRALVAPLNWVLREATPVQSEVRWVDACRLPRKHTLADRVGAVRQIESFDLLFIHRDADSGPPDDRRAEIADAAGDVRHVPVIPVRMTESWLLPHEEAIREACGRPSGREPLHLPPLKRIEALADTKAALRAAIQAAMNVRPGRRSRQDPTDAFYRISDRVEDWSVLRAPSAFRRLEADTRAALASLGLPVNADAG
jgi:hypothetical protein